MSSPNTVTLPARSWAIMATVVVLMLCLLGLQLASIEAQRHTVIDQDRKATALLAEARPVLRAVDPLLGQAGKLAAPLARTGRQARRSLNQLSPVLADLPPVLAQLPPALTQLRPLLARLAPLVAQATPLVAQLNARDAAGALANAGRLAGALQTRGHVVSLLVHTRSFLNEIARRRLLGKAQRAANQAPKIVALLKQQLDLQITTLEIQRQTLQAQLRGLAIQEEALKHVTSLDRKTGGQLPAPLPAPLPVPTP